MILESHTPHTVSPCLVQQGVDLEAGPGFTVPSPEPARLTGNWRIEHNAVPPIYVCAREGSA